MFIHYEKSINNFPMCINTPKILTVILSRFTIPLHHKISLQGTCIKSENFNNKSLP